MLAGSIASGKSSLLHAILGEMIELPPPHSRSGDGESFVEGSIAYVPQQSYIMNTTVRENIIMSRPFDAQLFQQYGSLVVPLRSYHSCSWIVCRVIACAALVPDIQQMPAGDLTEIGERGITVSVGQRARISIARALYCQAQIYVLDDCFSALDAAVSQCE